MSESPLHHSVLVIDIEDSSSRRDSDLAAMRASLYGVLRQAFEHAGMSWEACVSEDRGDGVYVLIPASVSKADLITNLLPYLDAALRTSAGPTRSGHLLRLRAALNSGEVSRDQYGSSGATANLAFGLVSAQPVRDVLAAAAGARVVLVVSDAFYTDVIAHAWGPVDPRTYAPIAVTVKGTRVQAWAHVPGYLTPPGLPEFPAEPAEPAEPTPSSDHHNPEQSRDQRRRASGPTVNARSGTFNFGDVNYGGDSVAGDKYVWDDR